jgi:hypothetical protein
MFPFGRLQPFYRPAIADTNYQHVRKFLGSVYFFVISSRSI